MSPMPLAIRAGMHAHHAASLMPSSARRPPRRTRVDQTVLCHSRVIKNLCFGEVEPGARLPARLRQVWQIPQTEVDIQPDWNPAVLVDSYLTPSLTGHVGSAVSRMSTIIH